MPATISRSRAPSHPRFCTFAAFAAAFLFFSIATPREAAAAAKHPLSYWRELQQQQFHLPAGADTAELAREAVDLLASPDGAVRDEIAYSALEAWIYRDAKLDASALAPVVDTLVANARRGLGGPEGDAIYQRSFSVLVLAVVAAADLKSRVLDDASFRKLVDVARDALHIEKDLRGYVPGHGWAHATAHAADLVKFLARSPRLTPAEQHELLQAVVDRVASATTPFAWREDERLALALVSLAARGDAEVQPLRTWIHSLRDETAAAYQEPIKPGSLLALGVKRRVIAFFALYLDTATCAEACQAIRSEAQAALVETR